VPVDPSISLAAGTGSAAPPNPLNTINQFAQTQNALNQTKLFPLQYQQQQLAVNQGQLNQTRMRMQAVGAMLAPLAGSPNLTHADVMGALGGLKAAGFPTQEFEADAAQTMPTADGPELAQWFKTNVAGRIMSPDAIAAAVVGTPSSINTGTGIQPGLTGGALSANPGAFTPAGQPVQVYPSRSDLAQRVPGPPGTGGAPTTAPLGAVTPPALSGINLGTGDYRDNLPPGLRNPNAPPPPPGAALPGQVTTGLGPAQQQALGTSGAAATSGFQNEVETGTRAKMQLGQLDNMLTDAANFTTGTGAGKTLDIKRAVQSWGGPIGVTFGIDPNRIAAQESFDKIANQLADAQGARSDASLAVNQGANPHSSLSPEGVNFIIHQLQGNADYLLARQNQAAKWGDQTDYRGFSNWATQNLDPRYFQFNRLTPDEQRNYFTGIKSQKDRDTFKSGYLNAQQQGLLGQ
jgi:hypothetical protein